MNQIDKGLLISKGFMNEKELVNDMQIQMSALMEATVFAGALLDNSLDLTKLMTASLYIEQLASQKKYLHLHLYVQRCFADSRARGELDDFYVASLHEETLEGYALYFTLYLRKLVSDMNEARKTIELHRGLIDLVTQEKPVMHVPANKKTEEIDHD